jgi:hypothetical protein
MHMGIDLNQPRMRAVLAAALACALLPTGFRVGDFAAQVRLRAGGLAATYGPRQAAYDLKKLRAKGLVEQVPGSRRYQVRAAGARTIAALVVLREQVIKPILAGTAGTRQGRPPKHWTRIDAHYQALRKEMQALFTDLGLAAA